MQCERLLKQIKSWYIHVSNETMAPARMVAFIEAHAEECPVCQDDPDLKGEIKKITELVLPESKIPKAVRLQQEQAEMEKNADADEYHDDDGVNSEGDDSDTSDTSDTSDEETLDDESFDSDNLNTNI